MKKKSLVKNSFYNVCYKLLNIAFPLVTSIYVTRILKADSIGRVAAAQNIASYFTMLATMGIPVYGVKTIAKYNVDSSDNNKSFFEIFIINAVLSIVSSIGYYLFVTLSPYYEGKEILYYVTGINVIFNIINVDWYFQGIQEYGYITLRSFIVKILSLAALFIFVREKSDYILYAFISSVALVINYIFNIIRLRKYIKIRNIFDGLKIKRHLSPILVLFISTIAAEIYVLADTTMLDYMTNSSIVGYYSTSLKIIRIIRSLVAAISAVFLPQLSYYYNKSDNEEFLKLANRGLSILCSLSIACAFGLFMIADDAVVMFFGSEFIESVNTVRILSVSIVSVALSNFLGMQLLVTIGKEKVTTISTVCGTVVNITLNFFLIRLLQHNGAAIASAVTELIVMSIQIIITRRYIKLRYNVLKPLLASLCMCVAIFIVKSILHSLILRTILSFFVGVIAYAVIAYFIKDTVVRDAVQLIKKKLLGRKVIER